VGDPRDSSSSATCSPHGHREHRHRRVHVQAAQEQAGIYRVVAGVGVGAPPGAGLLVAVGRPQAHAKCELGSCVLERKRRPSRLTAHAMPTPSAVLVARPSSSSSTSVRGQATVRMCAVSCRQQARRRTGGPHQPMAGPRSTTTTRPCYVHDAPLSPSPAECLSPWRPPMPSPAGTPSNHHPTPPASLP
jgi:hypothetical protein